MIEADTFRDTESKCGYFQDKNKIHGNTHEFNTNILAYVQSQLGKGEKEINLSSIEFPDDFSVNELFHICKGHKDVILNFSNSNFQGDIRISDKIKNELEELPKLNFTNTHFYSPVHFIRCNFADTSFNNAVFHSISNFYGSYFTGCTFSKTIFEKTPVFAECCFSAEITENEISFNACVFHEDAMFTNALFLGYTKFHGTTFFGLANFSIRETRIFSHISRMEHFNSISFCNSNFSKVDFTNREFTALTDFDNCIFNKAPIFHGCKLHQHTIFPSQRNFKDTTSKEAVGAYRTLRIFMSDLKARREEAMFYSLEQESLKNSSFFYKNSSNYGQSIGLPIFWLFSTSLVALIVYGLFLTPQFDLRAKIDFNILKESFWLTFYQVVKPFSVDGFLLEHKNQIFYDGLFKVVASLQSLLSIVFIALLLLAIRWNFKKD